MRHGGRRARGGAIAIAVAIAGLLLPARGAEVQAQARTMHVIQVPQRLSDWLLAHPLPPQADPLALGWRSRGEVPGQAGRQQALVAGLKGRWSGLAGVLADMPATGRVLLPHMDPRWLQANPAADPVLKAGDLMDVPDRRSDVVVLQSTGHLCRVPHRSDVRVLDYLQACGDGGRPDTAWLVQPDGRVMTQGTARWNEAPGVPPAPGAWIWAPTPDDAVPHHLSHAIAAFLATQGPAPLQTPWSYGRPLGPSSGDAGSMRQPAPLPVIANDWGMAGLLQTPTARMRPAGAAGVTVSRVEPYTTLHARLQPFDWLELAFGYLSVSDRRYGTQALAGDQSYKDKSAHIKVRLLEESGWWPQVALGWRDVLGTGVFSGEYVVASKRWGPWDVSAGLGFGYVGGRGDVRNPLGLLSDRFDARPAAGSRSGGSFNTRSYFRGPVAFFGGVQYQTPSPRWVLKLEVEGNDYRRDFAGRPIRQKTPVNVGVVYRPNDWLDVTLGLERGNMPMLALSAQTQLDGLQVPKYLDPRPLPVAPQPPPAAGDPARTARDIEAQTGQAVRSIDARGSAWTVTLAEPRIGYLRPVVDRVAEVVHRDAPAGIDRIELRLDQHGTHVAQAAVDRRAWVREKTELVPPHEQVAAVVNEAPSPGASGERLHERVPPRWSVGVGLNYRQNLGGPDAFLLFQLAADVDAALRLRHDTWLAGTLRVGLVDNYDKFKYTADSQLPRVRTYVREYLVTSRTTVPTLQLTHLGSAGSEHFYLAYGGLLEPMFAGVGGEYLYRPVGSRWAFGIDVNAVRQRDFDQKFSLRDYRVTTGHATAYWDTGLADVLLKLSAGQYLAGDRGVTVDVSRIFDNGVSMGAYATRTDVSAERFGEGSFDKGVYVNIPFDAMLPRSGGSSARITYAPLIRDGGARLNRRYELYELTGLRGPRSLTPD